MMETVEVTVTQKKQCSCGPVAACSCIGRWERKPGGLAGHCRGSMCGHSCGSDWSRRWGRSRCAAEAATERCERRGLAVRAGPAAAGRIFNGLKGSAGAKTGRTREE